MSNEFERKEKGDLPVIAICYDFDKTLSPDDMQAQGFIQSVGYDVKTFWTKSNCLARENEMDQNLAYMYTMLDTSIGRNPVTKKLLREHGSKVKLFPGVEQWFSRIKNFGIEHNVIIEHYIISSGLKEMIEGNEIAKEFEKIYASSFYFDKESDVARWPAQSVNYTNKTQFLFRIQKGVLNINDQGVNEKFSPEKIRIPFRNMVYIGDSDTDIPCMKLVNSNGGHSIGVYDTKTNDKTKVLKMMRDERIRYFAPADYSEGSELDNLVKQIILRTEQNEKLEEFFIKNKKEWIKFDENAQQNRKLKLDAILSLESSQSFANTHTVIKKLQSITDWDEDEIEWLFKIGYQNSQVFYIIDDLDVKSFYEGLLQLKNCNKSLEYAKKFLTHYAGSYEI